MLVQNCLVIVIMCIFQSYCQLPSGTGTGTGISTSGGGTTAGGQTYTCVLPGTCPTGGSNTIDPRIVTPGQGQLCPPGLVPCFNTNSGCGIRSVTPTNNADGFADPGAYPWQAYLRNTSNIFAGSGVLLDNYHVLTAAHKVAQNVALPSAVTVVMGVYNPSVMTNTQSSPVARIVVHPQYNPTTLRNDIAILRLVNPVSLSNTVNTICMPPAGSTSTTYIGQRCVVSGWGQTSFTVNDAPTNPMKQVFVNIVSYATCRTSYSAPNLLGSNVDLYLDPTGEICAGGESQRDACSQDGGSPLVCPNANGVYSVAGLVIWGKNCGQPGVYGVYVSVPAYYNWIQSSIQTLNAAG